MRDALAASSSMASSSLPSPSVSSLTSSLSPLSSFFSSTIARYGNGWRPDADLEQGMDENGATSGVQRSRLDSGENAASIEAQQGVIALERENSMLTSRDAATFSLDIIANVDSDEMPSSSKEEPPSSSDTDLVTAAIMAAATKVFYIWDTKKSSISGYGNNSR